MKNKEKYKNELIKVIKEEGNICEFLIKHGVSKMFGKDTESFCGETECTSCTTALQLWLDEEYEEPPKPEVDWSKVPVDTLVMVRDCEDDEWVLRYFVGINEEAPKFRFVTWSSGATSKTAYGNYTPWKYCKLAEDEDNDKCEEFEEPPKPEVDWDNVPVDTLVRV